MLHRKLSRLAPVAALAAGALAVVPVAAQAAGSARAVCKGSDRACTATFSLAGGASNKRLTVELSGTDLKLVHVRATPAYVHGAYEVARGSYSLGGSVYTTTLNAVDSIGAGAKLILEFATPAQSLNCGGIRTGLAYLTVSTTGPVQETDAFGCRQAARVSTSWLQRFRDRQPTRVFTITGIRYGCRLVPRIPQNLACTGGGTVVRFAGPTGH